MSQASVTASLYPSVNGYKGVVPPWGRIIQENLIDIIARQEILKIYSACFVKCVLPSPQENQNMFRQVSAFLQTNYSSLVIFLLCTSAFGLLLTPILSQNGCNGRNNVPGKPKFEVLIGVFLLVLSLTC